MWLFMALRLSAAWEHKSQPLLGGECLCGENSTQDGTYLEMECRHWTCTDVWKKDGKMEETLGADYIY